MAGTAVVTAGDGGEGAAGPAPATRGTVARWDVDAGWGVVDSPQTPGGCWAAADVVEPAGHEPRAGEVVAFAWEDATDAGSYAFRARRVVATPQPLQGTPGG